MISVTNGDNSLDYIPAAIIVQNIELLGGPRTRATRGDGVIDYETRVSISRRISEQGIWYKGELRGFSERFGEGEPGALKVSETEVSVRWDDGRRAAWTFLEILSIQAASSTVQLSLAGDELMQFRFENDSPRRWEDLFRWLLQGAYDRADRGKIIEFQPRIRTS